MFLYVLQSHCFYYLKTNLHPFFYIIYFIHKTFLACQHFIITLNLQNKYISWMKSRTEVKSNLHFSTTTECSTGKLKLLYQIFIFFFSVFTLIIFNKKL